MPRLTVGVRPGGRIRLMVPPSTTPTEVWVGATSHAPDRLRVTVDAPAEVEIVREELLEERRE